MENRTDSKRKKDKQSDYEDDRRDKKMTKRHRSRSRSRDDRDIDRRRKRRHSRSRSPNVPTKQEKHREDAPTDFNTKKVVPERKAKETDMLNTRTGGAYIPPARLRMMQAQITDKSSVAYQRLAWEALKKSIHGHINKINVGNIGIIIKELLKENIVRGRGLLCRSVIQAQAASPTFTNVYAALVAAVNSRFPNIGELLLKRLVIQFKRGFKRNDKPTCISSASFIAHLVNQRVAHEILALELLTLLVESPTDDSVEVAIAFLKECGQKLTEVSTKGVNAIFEMLRNILHEGQLDKRVQYMIEVMFQVWKDGFKDHPALIEELELVPEEEQFTHLLMLDDATDSQDILNVFKFDDKYEENEQKYKTLSKEILGSDAESGDEDGSEESGSGESEDEEEHEGEQKGMTIIDNTETNLVALRRTIYLTINSSLDFEECAHKLMKMQLKPGQEVELCHMFLDCCAEQRTYEKFYGLLAQRFCNINRIYIGPFEEIFKDSYSTAHRLDTNRLRNVSKFFAHLLFTDSISWEVMECVKLNEEDTTSSSRIYIKILFQELAEYMGLKKLNDRLKDPTLQDAFSGIFPRDNPKNTRFSINFFTSIGLGGLTDELREHLKQMPKNIPAPVTDINVESESSSSSSSSSDSSSESSSSDSEEENGKKDKESKKSSEKTKSKQNDDNLQAEATVGDKSDKGQRWGHDGFYETYGDNARRHENRQERSGHNNFPRPRDRERGQNDEREQRNNRDINERRKDRNTLNADESRKHKIDSANKRQERERPYDRIRDETENSTNERHKKSYNRYERGRSDREETRRDEDFSSRKNNRVDDRKQDKEHRRGRDYNSNKDDTEQENTENIPERNDRIRVNKRNENENQIRNRQLEREKKDKEQDKNNRAQEDRHDRYKGDDRLRERIAEKEKREKVAEKNERVRMGDQNKSNDRLQKENRNKVQGNNDKVRDDDSNRNRKKEDRTKYKGGRQDEAESTVEDKRSRKSTKTKKKDRQNDSSYEEESKYRYKEGKNKSQKKEIESRISETRERNQRGDKDKKNNKKSVSEKKKTNKKTSKRDRRNKDASSSESSSSDSSSSDSSSSESSSSDSETENTGSRYWDSFDIEKPLNKDKNQYDKTPELKEKRYDKRRER